MYLRLKTESLTQCVCLFFWVSDPLCLSSYSALHFFPIYSFWVHHLVNRDERHLLAHAMASDFSAHPVCMYVGMYVHTYICMYVVIL
jgi:hypothetical protein